MSEHHSNPAENFKRIWLAPTCETDERSWCQDNQGCCDECGEPWVGYVRTDILDSVVGSLMLAQLALRDGAAPDGLIHVNDALSALTAK